MIGTPKPPGGNRARHGHHLTYHHILIDVEGTTIPSCPGRGRRSAGLTGPHGGEHGGRRSGPVIHGEVLPLEEVAAATKSTRARSNRPASPQTQNGTFKKVTAPSWRRHLGFHPGAGEGGGGGGEPQCCLQEGEHRPKRHRRGGRRRRPRGYPDSDLPTPNPRSQQPDPSGSGRTRRGRR